MGTLLITSLLSLHLLFSPYVLAAPSGTPRGQAIREEAQVRNAERRASIAANLTEIRQERITKFFERMVKRLEAAITRLERLITRIESRIAKIAEADEDIDTGPITDQVNDAKDLLADAEALLADVQADFATLLTSDDPKIVFKQVRANISEIKQLLIEVHRILVHLIGDIKGLRVGQSSPVPSAAVSPSPAASPSPSPTPVPSP
ncbi:MAG: hypothetical protein AAB875_00155 [Patescibacteria group bacterium]